MASDSYQIKIGGGVKPEVFASLGALNGVLGFASSKLASFGATFAAAFSLQRIGAFIAGSAKAADALADLREETGLAIETLGGLKLIADSKGLGEIDMPMKKFSAAVREAQVEGTKFNEIFKRMGVDPMQDLDKVLFDVADKFASWEDGINKLGIAEEIFGTRQTQFIQLLNAGSEAMKSNITDFAATHGSVEDAAKAVDEYNAAMARLKSTSEGLGQSLMVKLEPVLTRTAKMLRIILNPPKLGPNASPHDIANALGFAFGTEIARGQAQQGGGGKVVPPNVGGSGGKDPALTSLEAARERKNLQIEWNRLLAQTQMREEGQDELGGIRRSAIEREMELIKEREQLVLDSGLDETQAVQKMLLEDGKAYEDLHGKIKSFYDSRDEIEQRALLKSLRRQQEQASSFEGMFANMANAMAVFAGEGSAIYKAFATSQAIASTAVGAIGAFAQASTAFVPPLGQIIGGIAAATVVAAGAAQIAKINGAFYEGGFTGNGATTDVAGVVHGREYVIPADKTAAFGIDFFEGIRTGNIQPVDVAQGTSTGSNVNVNVMLEGMRQTLREFQQRDGIKIVQKWRNQRGLA